MSICDRLRENRFRFGQEAALAQHRAQVVELRRLLTSQADRQRPRLPQRSSQAIGRGDELSLAEQNQPFEALRLHTQEIGIAGVGELRGVILLEQRERSITRDTNRCARARASACVSAQHP